MTVKQIQCLLTYLGYSPGTIDGIEGRNTQVATLAFQADYGLTVDGIPGAATQKMLIGAIAGTAVKVEKPESSDAPKTGRSGTTSSTSPGRNSGASAAGNTATVFLQNQWRKPSAWRMRYAVGRGFP